MSKTFLKWLKQPTRKTIHQFESFYQNKGHLLNLFNYIYISDSFFTPELAFLIKLTGFI